MSGDRVATSACSYFRVNHGFAVARRQRWLSRSDTSSEDPLAVIPRQGLPPYLTWPPASPNASLSNPCQETEVTPRQMTLIGEPDAALFLMDKLGKPAAQAFIEALGRHRHPEGETDPPAV